jgi:hypothetical protein
MTGSSFEDGFFVLHRKQEDDGNCLTDSLANTYLLDIFNWIIDKGFLLGLF